MSTTDSTDSTTPSDSTPSETDTDGLDLQFPWHEAPDHTFDDVGGLEHHKETLHRTVVKPIRGNPEQYDRFGVPIPNILLSGPPGTGKTYLARALAGETMVPWVKLTGAAIQSKWINESTDKVNRLFREAAAIGDEHGYAMIFLDEIDTILPARGGRHHAEDEKVVNEFLRFLERCHDQQTLVVGATNRPDRLDPAAIREGRFDRQLEVGLPDSPTRKAILDQQFSDRPTKIPDQVLIRVANHTDGWTAAALEQLVIEAARQAIHNEMAFITPRHIDAAVSILEDDDGHSQ